MGKILGIDLGTSNSVVAVLEGGKPKIIKNNLGARRTPSVVAYKHDGERLVGDQAKRQAITNPHNTIFSIKRFIGRKYKDVVEEMKTVPYQVVKGPKGIACVKVLNKVYTPQEISATVLQKLKQTAEDYLGERVSEAVITTPAYFNDAQRKATIEAGEIVGLKIRRIINEPTAAALAYGLDKRHTDRIVAVYDLGGGTYNISILELGDGIFEVKATNGDMDLGGDYFDIRLIEYFVAEFKKKEGIELWQNAMALQRLRDAAEKAKIELSGSSSTNISLPFIIQSDNGPKHLNLNLTRSKFEQLVKDLVDRTIPPMEEALKDAGLAKSEIDEIILVGGSSRIPRVLRTVEEFFGKKPNRSVNPNEAVALGAAIKGGILSGDISDVLLLDVTPLNLGFETSEGHTEIVLPANTTIPTRYVSIISTKSGDQSKLDIRVFQGNQENASKNQTIGNLHLKDIPPNSDDVHKVVVIFDIDADGILNVSAKEKASGVEQAIRIEASSGLSKDQVEQMRSEARVYAADTKKRRERREKANTAYALIHATQKKLKEYSAEIHPAKKASIESIIGLLKEVQAGRSLTDLEAISQQLNNTWASIQSDSQKAKKESTRKEQAQNNTTKKTTLTSREEDKKISAEQSRKEVGIQGDVSAERPAPKNTQTPRKSNQKSTTPPTTKSQKQDTSTNKKNPTAKETTEEKKTKVFISHSSLDRPFVEEIIIPLLEDNGHEVWYSTYDINAASAWKKKILKGLKTCNWFLVILSPNAVASKWVEAEVDWALNKRAGQVIPVLHKDCEKEEIDIRLNLIQHIDFRVVTPKARKQLIGIWNL